MKYPSILLGAVQSCMKCQSVVEALITSPSVDRDVNFKSSAHTEISIKFIPSVKGLIYGMAYIIVMNHKSFIFIFCTGVKVLHDFCLFLGPH